VSWSTKNPSYTPDSSCNIRIWRAQLFKAEIIETVMRSVMNQERLGELLTLACERNLTDTVDLDELEIANLWSKLTKRGHFNNKNTMSHSKLYVFLQNS
jgi:hypothetical protein